ncbi:MAG: hypothetical protein P8X46_02375 [Nitrospirales bacterium]
MPTVADYVVLADVPFELDRLNTPVTNTDGRFDFDRPDHFVEGLNLAKPVLFYRVLPLPSVEYFITVNLEFGQDFETPQQVHEEAQLNGQKWRTMHEPISGSVFSQERNTIGFHVVSGLAQFSDVVLMYQRSI